MRRVIQEFGSWPGVHFGSRGGPWVAGKVRCHLTFRLHSEYVQGWGAGLGSMPHVKSGAPSRAEAGRQLSRFLVLEPGRAWLGPLWPNRGEAFGPQHVAFQLSPHPSPGAYKRSIAKPLRVSSLSISLRFVLRLALLPDTLDL